MATTQDSSTMINRLPDRVRGSVRTSESEGYDQDRTGFQLLDPHRPTVMIDVAGAADVRDTVEFAADHGMTVAVQATGHGRGDAMRGGVLINTRRMCGVEVNPRSRTAWVEAGARWRHVIDAATAHGLAPLSGSLPGVGAVSYTLGGGIGLLARRYGFAADHVHRLEVVTADGRLRHVTAADEPDLFWALRGGGGNFGIVTGMEIALMPVARIYGGCLFFDVAEMPHVLNAWWEWTATLPEEMTSALAVVPFPDLPVIPDPMRGRHIAQLQISYAGPAEEGQRWVEPLRAFGPLRDTVRELPYAASGAVFDEPDQPHGYRGTGLVLDELDPEALRKLIHRVGPSAVTSHVVGVRHLGGALARPPRTPNAVGHRRAGYSLGVLTPVDTGEPEDVTTQHDDLLAEFTPHVLGHSLNFTFGSLTARRTSDAFDGADYERLTRIKAEHDPHLLLHPNHPIHSAKRR